MYDFFFFFFPREEHPHFMEMYPAWHQLENSPKFWVKDRTAQGRSSCNSQDSSPWHRAGREALR